MWSKTSTSRRFIRQNILDFVPLDSTLLWIDPEFSEARINGGLCDWGSIFALAVNLGQFPHSTSGVFFVCFLLIGDFHSSTIQRYIFFPFTCCVPPSMKLVECPFKSLSFFFSLLFLQPEASTFRNLKPWSERWSCFFLINVVSSVRWVCRVSDLVSLFLSAARRVQEEDESRQHHIRLETSGGETCSLKLTHQIRRDY